MNIRKPNNLSLENDILTETENSQKRKCKRPQNT